MEYELRITKPHSEAKEWIERIEQLFQPIKSVWGLEIGTEREKEHFHGYILTDKKFKNDKDKQRQINKLGLKGNNCYHCQPVKDRNKFIAYCIKDCNVFKNTLTEEDMKEPLQRVNDFQATKDKSTFSKILYFSKEKEKLPTDTLYKCQLAVMKFYISIEGMPRNKGLLLYFANKLYAKTNPKKTAEDLLSECFGIDPDLTERRTAKEQQLLDKCEHLENRHKKLLDEIALYEDFSDDDLDL